MARFANEIDEFVDECPFQIGERVRIVIAPDVIPADEVKCNTGIVQKIYTKFMLTPDMRKFVFTVWLDGEYHHYFTASVAVVNQHQVSKLEVEFAGTPDAKIP